MSKDVCSYSENNLRLKGVQKILNNWKFLKITNKQNDICNVDYSQSKNKHLWTFFKHPNEIT